MIRAMRWSDEDVYFGPFTYSRSKYRPWCLMLSSWGGGADDDNPCHLRISAPWVGTLIVVLPPILKPHITKVYPATWGADTIARLGRDWYEDIDERSYGFTMDGAGDIGNSTHLSVHYGRAGGSMMDSSIEQRWGCFLPWTQWRHVRISYYGLNGELIGEIFDKDWPRGMVLGSSKYDAQREVEKRVPKVRFTFEDFDGEPLVATTHIEEREWRRGTGWFKWMSLIWPKKVRRSLDIAFSGETGKRKGSWKGGTIGAGIEMQHDDTHFAAFSRYCRENHMKFVGWEV